MGLWMRTRSQWLLIGLTLFSPGCALIGDGTCVAIHNVTEAVTDFGESVRNRKWAEAAFQELQHANPNTAYSDDYARGFKDGFANYLYRGGHGEPPLLPPPRYRKLRYQSLEGYQAIEDWFAGFRHGAVVARQNGYRQWVTGPSALRGLEPVTLPEPAVVLERPIPLKMPSPQPLPKPLPPAPPAQRQSASPPRPAAATLPMIVNGESRPQY